MRRPRSSRRVRSYQYHRRAQCTWCAACSYSSVSYPAQWRGVGGGAHTERRRLQYTAVCLQQVSTLMLMGHFIITMELTPHLGRLEIVHLVLFWVSNHLCYHTVEVAEFGGVGLSSQAYKTVFFTYPVYVILDKVR